MDKIARPYARAAYTYARDTATVELWLAQLNYLCWVVEQESIRVLIQSPRLSAPKKAEALIGILKEILKEPVIRFIFVLAENRRLACIPAITKLFDAYFAEDKKTVSVEVISAVPIESTTLEAFQLGLKKRLGREVLISCSVDPTLIGGALIRAGDLVIDGSLRSQLQKMASVLIQ